MNFWYVFHVTFIIFHIQQGVSQTSFLDSFIVPYRIFRAIQQTLLEQQRSGREPQNFQPRIDDDIKFPCSLNNTKSQHVPYSVHKLKPGDIKIIGTIGDSLSAGLAITSTNLLNLAVEQRSLSFTQGGQNTWREFLTFPNILRVFNPNLIGYSLKPSSTFQKESQFNVAETGAISADTLYMAKVLIKRIKNDPRVNLKEDWKMINILMGANDFCTEICYTNPPELILDRHKKDLLSALRMLRDNLPRTFVNLIPPPNVQELSKFKGLPRECYVSLSLFCPCIVGLAYRKFQEKYSNIIAKWQQLDVEMADYKEFNTDDFQVVAQPIFINFSAPTTSTGLTDFSYFAADCFHFSQKGGAQVAKMLWNALLKPIGQKNFVFEDALLNLNCPSEDAPYLYTRSSS